MLCHAFTTLFQCVLHAFSMLLVILFSSHDRCLARANDTCLIPAICVLGSQSWSEPWYMLDPSDIHISGFESSMYTPPPAPAYMYPCFGSSMYHRWALLAFFRQGNQKYVAFLAEPAIFAARKPFSGFISRSSRHIKLTLWFFTVHRLGQSFFLTISIRYFSGIFSAGKSKICSISGRTGNIRGARTICVFHSKVLAPY
jgi:hypothetical protein